MAAPPRRRGRHPVRHHGVPIHAGQVLVPTAKPLPHFAYPFLVATLLGWAWTLLREEA